MRVFEQIKPDNTIVVDFGNHRYKEARVLRVTQRMIFVLGGLKFNRKTGDAWGQSDYTYPTHKIATTCKSGVRCLMTFAEAAELTQAAEIEVERKRLARLICSSYQKTKDLPLETLQWVVRVLEIKQGATGE